MLDACVQGVHVEEALQRPGRTATLKDEASVQRRQGGAWRIVRCRQCRARALNRPSRTLGSAK